MSPRQSFIESLPMARRVVRRDGITLHLIRYWSDMLTAWIGKPQKMEVRYDPHDLSRIYLQGPDGDYLDLSYRDLCRPPISLREHQLALKHLRKVKHVDVSEEAIFHAVKLMGKRADDARTEPKNTDRCRTRGLRLHAVGPAEPPAHPSPEKHIPSAKKLNDTKNRPRGQILAVEEWS